ncbi:hypothetical protein GQ55_3G238900 [Panicum hallii var. hallii]|uniref:PWWP domain-containing protein n=1 Tax=Panicum hallii var. hallii TaxID=1504633 RepID=A0A2T7ECQ7_9POAL|nr:hypothetical protein GQ55_3G238900 [Panicum hallii var. hallii]
MLTRSPYEAAMSSDPGGGGGGTKLEGQAARTAVLRRQTRRRNGGLAMVSGFLYKIEAAGMVDAEIDMWRWDGGELGVESGGLQSEEEAAAKIVERSAYHTSQHAEAELNKSDQSARYCLPHLDSGDIRVSDLVRDKLEGYNWWPGEIFDPSDASELALKHQISGNHLVVFFGDDTFAWCDESQLMPFMTNYAQMEKQSNSDMFVNAVNHALEELVRQILLGMSCLCSPEELSVSESGMSYLVENHGLRDGVTSSTTNRAEVLKHFCPKNLVQYVKLLALCPGQGGDLLELVIACSQLTSFYRSKGFPELATFQTTSGRAENAMDALSAKNVEEDVSSIVDSNYDKSREGIRSPRKQKPEDGIESMEKNMTSYLFNSCNVHSPVVEMTDHTLDSCWSELSLHNDPIYSLKRANTRTKHTHKRRSSPERSVPSSQQVQPATLALKKIQVMERPIIHVNAKMAHEVKLTALVLRFGRSTALSLEMDLIKMFRGYEPLKQTETEVHKDTNTVMVVFKKRIDAERAFSVAGNYCTFGPWLQSYCLVNMPFSLGPLEASNPVTYLEAN